MIEVIDAGLNRLMEQASQTSAVYLANAVEVIDKEMGRGYAIAHPELLGLFIIACAIDCAGLILAQQIRSGLNETSGHSLLDSEPSRLADQLEYWLANSDAEQDGVLG